MITCICSAYVVGYHAAEDGSRVAAAAERSVAGDGGGVEGASAPGEGMPSPLLLGGTVRGARGTGAPRADGSAAPLHAGLLRRCTALIQVVLDEAAPRASAARLAAVLRAVGVEREQLLTASFVRMHAEAQTHWLKLSKKARPPAPSLTALQPLATLLAMCWRVRRRAIGACLRSPTLIVATQRTLHAAAKVGEQKESLPFTIEASAVASSGTTVEVRWSVLAAATALAEAEKADAREGTAASGGASAGAAALCAALSGVAAFVVEVAKAQPCAPRTVLRRFICGPAARRAAIADLHPDANFTVSVSAVLFPEGGSSNVRGGAPLPPRVVAALDTDISTHSPELFTFDHVKCGPNLSLSNGGLTATNTCDKQWNAVRTTEMFTTGVHCWEVRVDRCVSKNIFIGIIDENGSVGNYVGSDDHGWGFLANRAVWHKKAKTKSYGRLFRGGDIVGVRLDVRRFAAQHYAATTPPAPLALAAHRSPLPTLHPLPD